MVFEELLFKLKENNLMLEDKEYYKLTEDGLFWGNNISREILTTQMCIRDSLKEVLLIFLIKEMW